MNAAVKAAEEAPRAESSPTTWVSKQTLVAVLQTYPGRIDQLVAAGEVRRRQIAGARPQFSLEDALRIRA